MKSKTFFICMWVFIIGILLAAFLGELSYSLDEMNPFDYARITDVEYEAVVLDEPDSRGSVYITERLTFDVHAASKNNLFWELWRELPENYVDGVKVDYEVHSVKQILDDGTEIIYEESPKLYWDDEDYVNTNKIYGPGKWFHSEGPYDEDAAQYECVLFYVDGLYRENVVFEIEYTMNNAALRYHDCSDLYLSLYSGDTIKHLNSYKAQILFPNKDMPAQGNYDVHTYGTNANEFPYSESADINPGYYTFSIDLDENQLKFRPYNEYIEFDLVSYGEDKGIFTEYAPSNYYSSDDVLGEIYSDQQDYIDEYKSYKGKKMYVFVCALAIAVFVLIHTFTTGKRIKAKNVFYKPTTEIEYFRDIPSDLDPNFATKLVFCKHKVPKNEAGVYSALLLSLARKKYVELTENRDGEEIRNVDIALKKFPKQLSKDGTNNTTAATQDNDKYEPLTPCEENYFNLIARHAQKYRILMSNLQSRIASDYQNTETFSKNMQKNITTIGMKGGYFQTPDYDKLKKSLLSLANTYLVAGILLITIVNLISYQTRMDLTYGAYSVLGIIFILSAVYLKLTAPKYVLLTQFGEDEYAKWRGLYNFLNSDTLLNERTIVELPVWEKYLVYATAFGISKKVIEAISIRCPKPSTESILGQSYYRSSYFHRSGLHIHSSVRSGTSIARSGGYSGGGGGFSGGYGGGGRGGGGGGGGH